MLCPLTGQSAEMPSNLPRQICSRPFGEDELKIIRNVIYEGQAESINRSKIARQVCRVLGWRNAKGDLKEMGARVALLRLHRQDWITLPEPNNGNGNGSTNAQRLAHAPVPQPPASTQRATLGELGAIELHKVENKTDSLLWDALIERYHYLGHSALSGAQVRYLIQSDQGLLGAIGFGAAAFTLKGRDQWIGWSRQQREQRRERVLNNRRFLILPWVQVPNLASHILSKAARRVSRDFPLQYGYTPLLLETFVEQARFNGGCYRAANWINVGATAGRGRNDRTSHRQRCRDGSPLPIKQIWLYPLRRDARKRLRAPLATVDEALCPRGVRA